MGNRKTPLNRESFWSKILVVSTIIVIVGLAVGVVFAIYYFGLLGLFSILGVQYGSLFGLFLFVLFYFLLSIPGDIVVNSFVLLLRRGETNESLVKWGTLFIRFLVNWSILSLLHYAMHSVTVTTVTQVVVALGIAIVETVVDKEFQKKN
ncbi:YrvL family regulatory protein [Alkalihalobacterium bogoriense]|uniref:YrvL family regulatory protein n=1 Tax=Alkalihalobacterium bogoriense TaxID=246272 RepID=UPI00047C4318|nr:YrvL family regulatory protein [Alkalihalobacterium bogoriense]